MRNRGVPTSPEVLGDATVARPARKRNSRPERRAPSEGSFAISKPTSGVFLVCRDENGKFELIRTDDFIRLVTDIVQSNVARVPLAPAIENANPAGEVADHEFIKVLENPPKAGEKLRALLHMSPEL